MQTVIGDLYHERGFMNSTSLGSGTSPDTEPRPPSRLGELRFVADRSTEAADDLVDRIMLPNALEGCTN